MKYVRFFGDNGYGAGYEEFISFENDEYITAELDALSVEYAIDNAEKNEYMATDSPFGVLNGNEKQEYFSTALSRCGWEYITEQKFKEIFGENF